MKKFILTLFIGMLATSSAYAAGNVGEYMYFGDYNGYDVKYNIVNVEDVDGDGLEDYLLAASDIIMYKAVDKSTNKWIDTALREWLNSSGKTISWKAAVPDAYKDETGFLSEDNMNSYERSLIIPVTHKSIYPWTGGADGGSADWTWNDGGGKDFRQALTNYDSAYYKLSTEKVFIPSLKELSDYNVPMNVSAAESAGSATTNGAFILRDATARTTNKMRYYYQFNNVSTTDITSVMGIRPMMYISGNVVLKGSGTKNSPYYIEGGRDDEQIQYIDEGGEVGEYVNFGDYNGYDMRYYIAAREDVNSDGVKDYLLATSDIIMYKAADKSTNVWENTALREWLNSDVKTISWKAAVPDAYKDETGFLSEDNMNSYERSLIIPVTHKSIYPWTGGADGGSADWTWNDGGGKDFRLSLTNYDEANYKLSRDLVFIPSLKELAEYNVPVNVGASESAGGESSDGAFLLRDATARTTNKMRYYYQYNHVSSGDVTSLKGIRTMMYIDGNAEFCGNGTKESPYFVYGGRDGDGLAVKDYYKDGDDYTLSVKNKSRSDAVAYLIAAVYDESGTRLLESYIQKAEVTPARSKTVSVTVPDADNKNVKLFYWDTKYKPIEVHVKNMTESGELKLGTDMFIQNEEHMGEYVIENAFDSNEDTWFAVSDLLSSSLTFAFKYPATLTSISFTHVDIDDWDMVKTIDIYAYNDSHVYRNKISNPIYVGELKLSYPYFSNNKQSFDLKKYSELDGVTHLILKPSSLYKRSGKGWGGFEQMSITGSYDRNDISVEKLTNPQIISNNEVMELLGIDIPKNPSTDDIVDAFGQIGISVDSEAIVSAETIYNGVAVEAGYTYAEYKNLGIGSLFGIERLTKDDVQIAICDALMTPIKGQNKLLVDRLYDNEIVSETTYIHIMDKLDIYKNAHIGEFSLHSKMKSDSEFEFARQTDAKEILQTNFSYNMPFHYEGGYLGTLPIDNAKSRQTDFAKSLKEAGAKSLRFPGGTCAHQYFTEGESYAQKLSTDIRKWGGLYDVNSDTSNYYIKFYDFIDFCSNNGIDPIFQVNTSFYVEPADDKIHAITKNRYVAEKNGDVNASYYDRDRIDEAADALGSQIDKLLSSGRTIKYWEIGNEEFSTLNYLGTSLSDSANPATENYAKISTAFIRVIKEKIPDAYIVVTGGFPNLESYYDEYGVTDLIDSMSTHYPFSNWTSPAGRDVDNLSVLLSSNEVEFTSSAKNYTGKIPQCTTETMTYRFENWDSGAIQQTFAMALNTAHQWGEAVFETPWEITTLHDLESSYFGFVQYNKKIDVQTRYLVETDAKTKTEEFARDYRFADEYMVNPSAKAIELLSHHIGGTALKPSSDSSYRAVSTFVSEKDGKLTLTVVNRMNVEKQVSIKLKDISLPSQTAEGMCMYGDNLSAMLPREYNMGSEQLMVDGDTISFEARPYSIYQFVLCE